VGDFEEKLNAILSNPQAMAQVANLAQSLNLGANSGTEAPPTDNHSGDTSSTPPNQGANFFDNLGSGLGDLAGLGNLLGQVDPALLQKLLPLVRELLQGNANDQRMQLLYALQPFLKPERREKVERAAKAAKLLHMGKKFLINTGDEHV